VGSTFPLFALLCYISLRDDGLFYCVIEINRYSMLEPENKKMGVAGPKNTWTFVD